jgi:lysophospholipase L1-like esterase
MAMTKPKGAKIYLQNVADKPVPRIGEQPWMIDEAWRALHESQLKSSGRAKARVVFLGDSITRGWTAAPAYRDYFGDYMPLNLGLAGDHTQNVLWRIEQGTLDGIHPEVIVVQIGVNNLAGGFTPEQTVGGVRAVVAAVQARLPNTAVLLLAILPAKAEPTDPLRKKIEQTNRALAQWAPSARIQFHDVGSVLLERDGTISKATLRDYIHPTNAGYERLAKAVAPLIANLDKPRNARSDQAIGAGTNVKPRDLGY